MQYDSWNLSSLASWQQKNSEAQIYTYSIYRNNPSFLDNSIQMETTVFMMTQKTCMVSNIFACIALQTEVHIK